MPVKKKVTPVQDSSVEDIVGKPTEAASDAVEEVKEEKAEEVPAISVAPAGPVQAAPFVPRPVAQYQDRYEQQPVPTQVVKGFLDIQPEGHGFLRPRFIPSQRDIYISQSQIRRFMLRPGDLVEGLGRPPKDTERYFGLLKVEKVNDLNADDTLNRPYFDELVPIYPKKQVVLTTGKKPLRSEE